MYPYGITLRLSAGEAARFYQRGYQKRDAEDPSASTACWAAYIGFGEK